MAGDESSPRTFSMTTYWGCSASIASAMCDQRPERVPGARPARLPTVLTSCRSNVSVVGPSSLAVAGEAAVG